MGTDGTLGWGKGRDQTGTSNIKGRGRGNQTKHSQEGQAQGKVVRTGKDKAGEETDK